jgi:S-adenosylmethionine decarboxylase
MVKEHCPSSVFRDLFYSHCKFIKPDLQVHPHTNFADESSYLDSIFSNGAAYILGRINGKCWYLYLVENLDKPLDYPDQTLEILMTNVDAEVLGKFSKAAFDSADDLTEASVY